ncbi:MAG: S24 family peptidase [Inquilinaceae bacterium]
MSASFRAELARRMTAGGLNPRSLALRAGLNATAVRDILAGRSKNPLYGTVLRLADALGCDPADLMVQAAEPPPPSEAPAANAVVAPRAGGLGSRDLPVYSSAEGGPGGAMILGNEPIEWVKRPEPLFTVRDGFGVYVVGESMEPAYYQGDVVLIHPSIPPQRDRDVVLLQDRGDGGRHALVKRLLRWNEGKWFVRQFNPPRDYDLARRQWQTVHRIVGKYHGR